MAKGAAEKPEKKESQGSVLPVKKKKEDLFPVESLADNHGLPAWERAALMAAAGWAPGKQVSETQFAAAMKTFRGRPQGGGRIQV